MQHLGTWVNVDLSVLGEWLGSVALEGFSSLSQTLEGICCCLLLVKVQDVKIFFKFFFFLCRGLMLSRRPVV